MTENLRDLLDRATPVPSPSRSTDMGEVFRASRRRQRRRTSTAVTGVVLAVAVVAIAAGQLSDVGPARTRTVYAGSTPELGTVSAPVDVAGNGRTPDGGLGSPTPGPADLLARVDNVKGTAVLLGVRVSGGTCVSTGYLPPAVSLGSASVCARGTSRLGRVLGADAIVVSGFGPGGAPGGTLDPPATYGSAPPGTRLVSLARPGQADLVVPARDGGDRYDHAAFFMATWDLGAGPTTATARAADGRKLAERLYPYDPRVPTQQRCQIEFDAMRSHFFRALMVGKKYASTHPATDDPSRFAPPVRGRANTVEGATELFQRGLRTSRQMAPEELYEYRLAANVVLGQTACFPEFLRNQAADFKRRTA